MQAQTTARRCAGSSAAVTLGILALVSIVAAGCGKSDASVQSEVQKQLAADATTASAHLSVTVTKGVARISGETDTREQQTRALDIARAVKGVTQAESAMRLSDAALSKAVKDAITADPSVASVPLRIEAHDGKVQLFSDQTNQDQRTRIVQLARSVDGVVEAEDDMK